MSARDSIENLWDRSTPVGPLLDAYRYEVLRKAVGRLRAIPVDCTALTGPVWYGDGWNSAITQLEEIADYQTPDDEAFPGELERLRTLVLQLRVAVIRKADLVEAERLLAVYEEARKKATGAQSATATPEFFQPGHSYTHRYGSDFQCVAITAHPVTGQRLAMGWHVDGWGHTPVVVGIDQWRHEYDGVQAPDATEGEARA